MAIFEALNEVVDLLIGAGINATLDPQNLHIPGAWITLDTIEPLTLNGDQLITCQVHLIVGHPNTAHALINLDRMTHAAIEVLGETTFELQGIQLPNQSPEPLPALVGNYTLEVYQ